MSAGKKIRVEHWVVAERQGQTAVRNMLGMRERFDAVPFFWTEQYDFGLAYVGHAAPFDDVQIEGDLEKRDCKIRYSRDGRQLVVAVIHRDLAGCTRRSRSNEPSLAPLNKLSRHDSKGSVRRG